MGFELIAEIAERRIFMDRRQINSLSGIDIPSLGFEDIRFPLDLFSPTAKPRSCCGFGTVFGDDCDTRRSREDCDA